MQTLQAHLTQKVAAGKYGPEIIICSMLRRRCYRWRKTSPKVQISWVYMRCSTRTRRFKSLWAILAYSSAIHETFMSEVQKFNYVLTVNYNLKKWRQIASCQLLSLRHRIYICPYSGCSNHACLLITYVICTFDACDDILFFRKWQDLVFQSKLQNEWEEGTRCTAVIRYNFSSCAATLPRTTRNCMKQQIIPIARAYSGSFPLFIILPLQHLHDASKWHPQVGWTICSMLCIWIPFSCSNVTVKPQASLLHGEKFYHNSHHS